MARMMAQPSFLAGVRRILALDVEGLKPGCPLLDPTVLEGVVGMAASTGILVTRLANSGHISSGKQRDGLVKALAGGKKVVQGWMKAAQRQGSAGAAAKLKEVVGGWELLDVCLLSMAGAADEGRGGGGAGASSSGTGSSSAGLVAPQRQAGGRAAGEGKRGSRDKSAEAPAVAKACAVCGRPKGDGGAQLKACSGCKGILGVYYCGVSAQGWVVV